MPITFTPYQGGPPANAVRSFTNVPYYTVFTPLSVPTCQLWLDAADASTITGTNPITAWTDKSGKGRSVTITSGPAYSSTFNGKKTLTFNNNQITTSIASAVGTGDFTLIAVWYQSGSGTNTVLSLGTSASSSQSLGFSTNKYNFYQYGSAQESAYSSVAGSWVIQIGTRISSVKAVYINGVAGTTPSTDSLNVTDTTVTIGKGDGLAISGQIGEILIYTGTMTTTQRQTLESYLAQKWGLISQLPLSHLHYTLPAGLPSIIYVPIITYYSPRLYSFTSFTFTNAGATLQNGPILSQCLTAYSGTSWLSQYFTMTTQGYQLWTVPATRTYTIVCGGASCANPTNGYGYGAIVGTTVSLSMNQQIQILVGQMNSAKFGYTGGGGGTFVASGITPSAGAPLVVGGGGGGYYSISSGGSGQNGSFTTSGNASGNSVAGGTNGNGGSAPTTGGWGAGGAGFYGNGAVTADGLGPTPASSFVNGGTGAYDPRYTNVGSFGGGGYMNNGVGGGGGGGGYSGGGGSQGSYGGGGGSYPSNLVNLGYNLGQGFVVISPNVYSSAPTGGSATLSGFSLTGVTVTVSAATNGILYKYYITTSGSSIASPVYTGYTDSSAIVSVILTLATTYYVAITPINLQGSGTLVYSTGYDIPGSVTPVVFSSISTSGFTLTWNTATLATGYNWYIGTTVGGTALASGSTASTSVSYSMTLSASTTYYGWIIPTSASASGITYPTGGTKTSGAVSYTYTGYIQSYIVPSGRTSISVTLAGAGGGGSGGGGADGYGGAGALVTGTLAVTAGNTYYIIVGGGGASCLATSAAVISTAFGGGGSQITGALYSGCGGGRSAIQATLGTDIVDAGGGGGAGFGNAGAGGSNGANGTSLTGGYSGGGGGTQSAGGANYTGETPTSPYGNGSGGGGFFGGFAGYRGGGGGGSSLTSNLTGVTVTTGGGGAGAAAASFGLYGTNGYITIV